MGSPFAGPTPPYNNPPIQPLNYQPRQFFIEDIILGQTTTVTATTNLDYVIGQLVRLLIPPYSGSIQLNEKTGYVIDIPASDQVTLQIDSSVGVTPFVSSSFPNQPQILAVGDINSGVISNTGANIQFQSIPGSFVNIS